jgi:PTH1 family peptidyl-tRNA hydrolase
VLDLPFFLFLSKYVKMNFLDKLLQIFSKPQNTDANDMNHLIVGLGNIGSEYAGTRHNIGFTVLDAMAETAGVTFQDKRYGFVAEMKVKNQNLILLKPSTYMNLSGNAVRYWMKEKKIDLERVLVVVDDLALPFGALRMKPGGSEAGHNGLRHITQTLGTQQYARLRFGIGNDFPRGGQVDFVLGKFSAEDLSAMPERLEVAAEMIKSFALSGIQFTMNHFNKK